MPLFITADTDNKLDATDAQFVDVYHTNSLVQGKMEKCGHVDFYLNGGILQPGEKIKCKSMRITKNFFPELGCTSFGTNPFQCSQ